MPSKDTEGGAANKTWTPELERDFLFEIMVRTGVVASPQICQDIAKSWYGIAAGLTFAMGGTHTKGSLGKKWSRMKQQFEKGNGGSVEKRKADGKDAAPGAEDDDKTRKTKKAKVATGREIVQDSKEDSGADIEIKVETEA